MGKKNEKYLESVCRVDNEKIDNYLKDLKRKPPITLSHTDGITSCDVFNGHSSRGYNLYANILLHIPHSSMAFPNEHVYEELSADERLLIDYYTDELFQPRGSLQYVSSLVYDKCRLYCDVERLAHDPLEEKGLGIIYVREGSLLPTFTTDPNGAREDYINFQTALAIKLVKMAGTTLMIDCHSFSSRPTLLVPDPSDIDICIGFNDDWSKPHRKTLAFMEQYFTSCGYKVGLNAPFSNSKTVDAPIHYHSVMIEINKRLYMDEDTLDKTMGFFKLRGELQRLYQILLGQKSSYNDNEFSVKMPSEDPYANERLYKWYSPFPSMPTLDMSLTKVLLHILKSHLEEALREKITDDVFVSIVKALPMMHPARPLGDWSRFYGYIYPIQQIFDKAGYSDSRAKAGIIGKFLMLPPRGLICYSNTSTTEINLDDLSF